MDWCAAGRWTEPTYVALAALLLFGAYAWLAHYGIDVTDEGYFLDLASRVQHGQLPYRDFDTYYTPGLFYVNAAILHVFGSNVLPSRILLAAIRLACALVVYGLARRLAPPPFAAAPALIVALMALLVGLHPGWPALLATLLLMDVLARADATRKRSWLLAAGVLSGGACLFKQNVGAFAIIAALGYIVLRPQPGAGLLHTLARIAYTAVIAVVTRAFLGSALDPLLSTVLWLPLLGTLLVLLVWRTPRGVARSIWSGVGVLLRDGAAFGLGVVAITALWLVPLALALGPRATPFALFLGSVNQGALNFALEAPPRGIVVLGLCALWIPLAIAVANRPRVARLIPPFAIAALATPLVLLVPTRAALADQLALEPIQFPRLVALDVEFGSLFLYLPMLCAWCTLLLLAARSRRRRPPPLEAWFLLTGTLAALALFPRADNAHAVLAGAPLLVLSSLVLHRLHARLTTGGTRLGSAAAFFALLVVPVAAMAPHLYARYLALAHPEPTVSRSTVYVDSGLERAGVLLPLQTAGPLRATVDFLDRNTAPGETVFTYPVDPMLNFLADRPNPTRFDHFIPGALTPEDMHAVVADLESARPRFVVWDHGGVVFWRTDRPNRILSDYIWQCYKQVAAFRLYLVLERTDTVCAP